MWGSQYRITGVQCRVLRSQRGSLGVNVGFQMAIVSLASWAIRCLVGLSGGQCRLTVD